MAPQATEICYLTFKAGVELEGDSPAAKLWSAGLKTVSEQDGYLRLVWGRTLEKPDLVMLFVDWASHAHHLKFINSPAYGPFVNDLLTVTTSIHLFHSLFTPPLKTTLFGTSPLIEFCVFFNVSEKFVSQSQKFLDGMGKPDGSFGGVTGSSLENTVGKYAAGGNGEGKAVVLCIGWENKEKHMEFRDSKWFGENVGLLRDGCEGGAEMFHVPFKTY